MTDTERIDWLQNQSGAALVNDDQGFWAVSFNGMQNLPMNPPDDVRTLFVIKKDEWKGSAREAIDAAMAGEVDN